MLDHGALERIEMAIKSPACVGLHTKNAECVEEGACVSIPRAKLFVLFINYRRLLITVPPSKSRRREQLFDRQKRVDNWEFE